MQSAAGAIEQLDEAARQAAFALLAVGRADGSPVFISGFSNERFDQLDDLVTRLGAAPIGIIQVRQKNSIEFEVEAHTLREFAGAPDHVRQDALRFLQKAVEAARDQIAEFLQDKGTLRQNDTDR